jgi:hypothetical protein
MSLWEEYLSEARYIGEVGIDAGPRSYGSLDLQKQVFERILRLCAKAGAKILVSDMQLFSQLTDRDAFAVRKTLNGKQGLMLAWGESGVLGGLFAEMQKLAQLIAKCRKDLVLGFAEPSGGASFRTGLHKVFDQEPAKSMTM